MEDFTGQYPLKTSIELRKVYIAVSNANNQSFLKWSQSILQSVYQYVFPLVLLVSSQCSELDSMQSSSSLLLIRLGGMASGFFTNNHISSADSSGGSPFAPGHYEFAALFVCTSAPCRILQGVPSPVT